MPLIRGHHSFDDQFTQIPNAWVRDSRLTFKARGILAMLLSHIEGWQLNIYSIAQMNIEGRDAIRTAINELEALGYLRREQPVSNGKFQEVVWITQDPDFSTISPPSGFPTTDKPMTENPLYKNTIKKENHNKEASLFDEFWNAYPRKLDKGKASKAFKSALKRASFEDIMAGLQGYINDPTRKPEFTKYPASWLNADSWLNVANLPEIKAANEERRVKEKARTDAYLAEMRALEEKAAPAPKCQHGKNLALCPICIS
jgi:hypothetical protein